MSIIADNDYKNLKWKNTEEKELTQILKGAMILEVNTTKNPVDTIEIILKGKDGALCVLRAEADTDNYININEVIETHKDQRQHRAWATDEIDPAAWKAPPLWIQWAKAKTRTGENTQ